MPPNDIISSAEAQQLVQRIARGYGWISQRARDASDEEALEAIDMLQESLGIAVRTYAAC
jgi:threonine synthase